MRTDVPLWKKYVWPALLVATIIVGIIISYVRIPVVVTEAEAQALLDEQLFNYNAQNKGSELGPARILFGDNEMTLDATGTGIVFGQAASAEVHTTGSPKYEKNSIYFIASNFSVEDLLINQETPEVALQHLVDIGADRVKTTRDQVLSEEPTGSIWSKAKKWRQNMPLMQ